MLKRYATTTSVFFVIKHDFNYIFQRVLIIFYNSTSLSHAMQDAMSWRGWVLKTMKVWKPKKILLRTHHGVDFQVKLYNAESVTHFGCKNWEALSKMYGFDEGM